MVYANEDHHVATKQANRIIFSDDYGATWTAPDTTLTGGSVTGSGTVGEPYLFAAPNGDLILMLGRVWDDVEGGTFQCVSSDGGETWGAEAPVAITGIVGDTDYMALLDDSFIYDGVIYLAGRISTSKTEANVKSILVKSEDNGATWTWVSDITSSGTNEVGIEYIGNNTIIAVLRGVNLATTYTSISTNMGVTWSEKVDASVNLKRSGKHRVYTLAHLQGNASWWSDSRMVMSAFVYDGSLRQNCIFLSKDAGASWIAPYYLDTQYGDGGYGDLFYNPNTDEVVALNYRGTISAAELVQYNVSVDWGS